MTGTRCRICGNGENLGAHRIREMYYGTREEFDYIECPSCRCLQIGTIPGDMSGYYPQGYYSMEPVGESFAGGRLKIFLRKRRNRHLFFREGYLGRILARTHPPTLLIRLLMRTGTFHGKRVLDVGCGSGSLAYYLKESGIGDVTGIDPFLEKDVDYGNGLRIFRKSIHDLVDESDAKFDLIMFNHSFEHVSDPGEALKASAALLRDGGVVMIRMPTVDSFAWENYGANWVQIDAPRHLHIHSRRSLELLSLACGLAITEVIFDSNEFQFWGSEQYIRDIPLRSPRSFLHGVDESIFSISQIRDFRRRAEELNREGRGDMAAYYLRKGNRQEESTCRKGEFESDDKGRENP